MNESTAGLNPEPIIEASHGTPPPPSPPSGDDLPKVGASFIALLVLGIFGVYLALVTPIAISLAIRVKALAPDNDAYLGLILGIASIATLVVGPLCGQLSDRTRSRFGRRRPWILAGMVVGLVGLAILGTAQTIAMVGIGWVVAAIGLSQANNSFSTVQADKLPESQRGRVAAMTGFATMVAPVVGAIVGGMLSTQPFLMFMIPGAVALVAVSVFLLRYRDADSRGLTFDGPLTVQKVLSGYVFSPRKYPDFSWTWLGRFVFFFGLMLNTTYTAFFFALRLGIPVADIGGTIALVGGLGVLGTIAGVFLGGFLSDKLRRRKIFVIGSGALFALGSVILVFGHSLPVLLAGSVTCNLALGVFSAVDQALFLDVLPERETEAGRFINLTQFATTIPQALAPIAAAAIVSIGVAGTDNYWLVYALSAVCTVIGGLIILKVRGVR